MTGTREDSRASWTLALMTELGQDSVERPTRSELDQGLNALYARIAAGRVRRRVVGHWLLAAAMAALTVLLVVQVGGLPWSSWLGPEPPALVYQVEGGSVLEGGYLRQSGNAGVTLRFSEGTTFFLMPGTRGRVRTVDSTGARVAIDNGTASFLVTPSRERQWVVEVGPFQVTVKGTAFTVSWDPMSEQFELNLHRGRVVVSGPVSGGELDLRSGQRLVVNLPNAETLITEDRPSEASEESSSNLEPSLSASAAPPQVIPEDGAALSAPSTAPSASTAAKVGARRRWAEELASGHWDRILEDVERAGVQATLNSGSSEELFAVASAARYRRRASLARAALLTVRRRFPGSSRSLDATFLLGRVEESSGGGSAGALSWYDEYLARAPTGAYAAEALGRKMTVISKVGGPAQVRSIAKEYLRRFPKGSYAGSARALLEVP